MANQQDKDAFAKELLRQFNRETKGMTPAEKEEYRRNMFVKKKTPAKKTMTAAKGGMAKPKRMRGGGMAKMAKKKMMRGGAVKKK
jgi:hypothetical protein